LKGLQKKLDRGFTLIESMISLTVASFIAIGITFLVSSLSKTKSKDALKIQLIEKEKFVESKLREDLSTAIRTTGQTRQNFSGMKLLSEVDPEKYPNGGLAIIVERYGQFSTPVEYALTTDTPPLPALLFKVDTNDLAAQYIEESLTKHKLYVVGNLQFSNLVRVVGPAVVTGSNPRRLRVPIEDSHIQRGEITNNTTNIRTAEVVLYYLKNEKIYRDVYADMPNATSIPISSHLISENVSAFDFDFAFEDRQSVSMSLPTQRLRDPKLYLTSQGCSGSNCCSEELESTNRCPTMNDVRDVHLTATYFASDSRITTQTAGDDGFSYLNGLLSFTLESSLIPLRYNLRSGEMGLVGERMDCPVNDMESRCSANCAGESGPFTNRVLRADGSYPADWWEYGDLQSNYCKCGNVAATFIPPELNWWRIPTWTKEGGSEQNMNYCSKHFPSCAMQGGESWVMAKNPASELACWCLQPSDWRYWLPNAPPFYTRNLDASSPQYGEFQVSVDQDLDSPTNPLAQMNDHPENEHNMRCWLWRTCDANARAYFTGLTRNTPWQDRCGCLNKNVDVNGVAARWEAPHRLQMDWVKFCNLDYRQGIIGQPFCPSAIDTVTGKYRLESTSNPQGLPPHEAALCECLNEKGINSQNTPYGNSGSWDLRAGSALQDPLLPPGNVPTFTATGSPDLQFGATRAMAVAFNAVSIESGVTTQVPVGGTCDRLFCDSRFPTGGVNCCTHDSTYNYSTPVAQRPSLLSLLNGPHGNYLDFATYCLPQCNSEGTVSINGRNVEGVHRVREIITGTAPGAQVPPICGQNNNGGTSGN